MEKKEEIRDTIINAMGSEGFTEGKHYKISGVHPDNAIFKIQPLATAVNQNRVRNKLKTVFREYPPQVTLHAGFMIKVDAKDEYQQRKRP